MFWGCPGKMAGNSQYGDCGNYTMILGGKITVFPEFWAWLSPAT
jgi:hypothetical protein